MKKVVGFYPKMTQVFKVVQRRIGDYDIIDTRDNDKVITKGIKHGKDARYLCGLKNQGVAK